MEYVAAGDVSAEGVHMLSTGGMLRYAEDAESAIAGHDGDAHAQVAEPGLDTAAIDDAADGDRHEAREVVVATETGMLYPLQMAAPDVDFIPANAEASCVYMKMITLPKLRDALREMKFEVRVPHEIAVKARVPIDRMVALG
jgi:quinolinate synthase